MPILILGLVALVVFLVMGFMLFGAMMTERRTRERRAAAAAVADSGQDEPSKTRTAHA